MIRLGVNVDHVATVRQARRAEVPDPVEAALLAEKAGALGITVHLREDRRHIQEHDVLRLRDQVRTKLNLEMAVTPAMVSFAERVRPDDACFVPENRAELTTEGGLDVLTHRERVREAVGRLQDRGIKVSLFVDPDRVQVEAAKQTHAHGIEIHTGVYCGAAPSERERRLADIAAAMVLAHDLGLEVHAGHGLDYGNVMPVARLPQITELNIGHSIVARAVIAGMERAVGEMVELLKRARPS
jgi:pyridoxine 5-phosphate synthase